MMNVDDIEMIKKQQSFAVVQLRPGTETKLLRVLLENGYTNISFTNAKGEMVKLIDHAHDDDVDDYDDPKKHIMIDCERVMAASTKNNDDGGSDGAHSERGDDDESTGSIVDDHHRRVSSEEEETVEDVDVDADVNVEDTDIDQDRDAAVLIAAMKENRENEELMMIKRKEKELLESLYPMKTISETPPSDDDATTTMLSMDPERQQQQLLFIQQQQRKFLEQLKEQHQHIQSMTKADTPTPLMEFSSLTLPTVLWGAASNAAAAAAAAAAATEPMQTPKFPNTTTTTTNAGPAFPYNPFLSAAVNPFLSYLPPTSTTTGPIPNSTAAPIHPHQSMPAGFFPTAAAAALWARHPQPAHHPVASQLLDTPPSTPRGGCSNESTCLITGAKLRQRGRQLRRHERDTSAYASCRLCRNRILANRLSNLHNHVRRHAVMKQFHCCYCSYAHTEVAKVRLHMLHNHKDDRSQPLDKRNDDMEAAWSLLMRECFPGYA